MTNDLIKHAKSRLRSSYCPEYLIDDAVSQCFVESLTRRGQVNEKTIDEVARTVAKETYWTSRNIFSGISGHGIYKAVSRGDVFLTASTKHSTLDDLSEPIATPLLRSESSPIDIDLSKALDALDDRERAVLDALYFEPVESRDPKLDSRTKNMSMWGLTYGQASRKLGIAITTLRRTEARALTKLKTLLDVDSNIAK